MSALADKHESGPSRRSSALAGLRITFSGLLCLAIVLLVGLAALNIEANLLFLLFGISLGVVILSAICPVLMVRKVDVERIAPMAVVAGRSFTLAYLVRSRRAWCRAWSLLVGEIPTGSQSARFSSGFITALGAGDERRLELPALCPNRGLVALKGVRVSSRFPFGLFFCSVDFYLPGELIVYPAVGRFRRDPWRDRRMPDSPAPHQLRRQSNDHEEFYGVREYRPGDNLRWIHWRRSARLGELIVRENTPARTQQLTIVLDPWPEFESPEDSSSGPGQPLSGSPSPPGRLLNRLSASWRSRQQRSINTWPDDAVEGTISLAATAVCDALERGHRVGLIARAGAPVVIAPSGGRSHRQRLLHELALLKPGAAQSLDQLVSRIRWSGGWHGRCLICATHHNRTLEHVLRLLTVRAESAIAIIGDSENFEKLFEAPSGRFTGPVAARRSP
ncbi:MAG TPA: DUF58 domain-containing protein [Phycisphaerae bacterium]|nr:DUF58 domain-containing protein [Phycisphaerae bacterium]HOB73790.1 DUF58 domain-containing protein [Phycisphaerae bacterium]HOJ56226.1 DUF58 domain-containing protein [Phycisphaerae bacterium]HOL27126.1 DUF58 domain-containing protein [Phycisphaerae bacterium]HPP21258.1 DUF58 domain-containing protein [Phycisphaerae bacterium]